MVWINTLVNTLVNTAKQHSLATVLLGAREGLGVDVGQGDVLVPLQVSHQHSDLGLHQPNPVEGRWGSL